MMNIIKLLPLFTVFLGNVNCFDIDNEISLNLHFESDQFEPSDLEIGENSPDLSHLFPSREDSKTTPGCKFFQGDIALRPDQEKMFNSSAVTKYSRTGSLNLFHRWPKNSGGFVGIPVYVHSKDYSEYLMRQFPNF
jgi:hypothetical protein